MAKLCNALAWYRTAKLRKSKASPSSGKAEFWAAKDLHRVAMVQQSGGMASHPIVTLPRQSFPLRRRGGYQPPACFLLRGKWPQADSGSTRIGIAQAAWRWCSKAPQTAAAARQSSPKRTCASDWHRRVKHWQSHAKELQCIEKLRRGIERPGFGFAAERTGIASHGSVQYRSCPVSHSVGIVSRSDA